MYHSNNFHKLNLNIKSLQRKMKNMNSNILKVYKKLLLFSCGNYFVQFKELKKFLDRTNREMNEIGINYNCYSFFLNVV